MREPLYFEQKLAHQLGIHRRDLKSVRDEILEKNIGWVLHGRDVALTTRGLIDVLKHLRIVRSPLYFQVDGRLDEDGVPEVTKAGVNGTTELIVHRTYPNPKLLEARTPAGELVLVTVNTNKNFRPKMKLRAHQVRAGRYEMEGRCPRFPGRY